MKKAPSPRNKAERAAFLLRGAAAATALGGLALAIWLIDKAIRYPQIQARQFGRFGETVPLWMPLIAFVVLFLGGIAYVFFRAAQRAAAGEDLFAQRHRRRPGDDA